MLSIERCPPIEDGPGQVILTTVSHLNRFVFRLTVKDASGKSETLGVTGHHKFYSETRKAWVSAKDLRDGERLGYLQREIFSKLVFSRDEERRRILLRNFTSQRPGMGQGIRHEQEYESCRRVASRTIADSTDGG